MTDINACRMFDTIIITSYSFIMYYHGVVHETVTVFQ